MLSQELLGHKRPGFRRPPLLYSLRLYKRGGLLKPGLLCPNNSRVTAKKGGGEFNWLRTGSKRWTPARGDNKNYTSCQRWKATGDDNYYLIFTNFHFAKNGGPLFADADSRDKKKSRVTRIIDSIILVTRQRVDWVTIFVTPHLVGNKKAELQE